MGILLEMGVDKRTECLDVLLRQPDCGKSAAAATLSMAKNAAVIIMRIFTGTSPIGRPRKINATAT
jgi:hypothetical protein